MPVPTHFRFTVRGDFLNSPEHFSFGFHMTREVGGADDVELEAIDETAVSTALDTMISSGSSAFGAAVKVTDWRAYVIGTDGRMEGDPLIVDVSTDDIKGTGTDRYPPQIALVATFVADNRGPARFGRFYLPSPAVVLGTNLRLSDANASGYAESVTQFLKGVSDAIDFPLTTSSEGCNVSTRGGAGAGTIQPIDHVEMGLALDTLRSRRRSLDEERHVHGTIDW